MNLSTVVMMLLRLRRALLIRTVLLVPARGEIVWAELRRLCLCKPVLIVVMLLLTLAL